MVASLRMNSSSLSAWGFCAQERGRAVTPRSASVLHQLHLVAVGVPEVEAPPGLVDGLEVHRRPEPPEPAPGLVEVVDHEPEVVDARNAVILLDRPTGRR